MLLPVAGASVEVVLDPTDCMREATEAVAFLDAYNDKLRVGVAPDDLASPSPDICRWCPYKLICSPFWKAAISDWSGKLDGAAIEGTVHEAPGSIYGGAAIKLAIAIGRGTEAPRVAEIAPLNPLVHPRLAAIGAGDKIRIVGIRVRTDGMLVPSERTVISRIADLPDVVIRKNPQ